MSKQNKRSTLLYSEFGMVPAFIATPHTPLSVDGASTTTTSSTHGQADDSGRMSVDVLSASSSTRGGGGGGGGEQPAAAPSASPDPALMLQRTWLDVQMLKDDASQKALLVDVMYDYFVLHCESSLSATYRKAFGDGSSLVSVLCRLLCSDTRTALRSGFPDCLDTARSLLDAPSHMVLLSYFSTICDANFFPSAVEQRNLDSIIRILALHNIPSMLVTLHRAFLHLVEHGKRDVNALITPHMAAADQKYLALLQNFLSFANAKPLLADVALSGGILHVAETMPTAMTVPFWASGSIAELAASLLVSVLHNPEQRATAFPPRVVEEVERAIMDGIMRDADSAHEEFGDQALGALKLGALTQSLTVLLALRRMFRSTTNLSFEFGLVVTVLLSLQDAMASQKRLTQRLITVLKEFATVSLSVSSLDHSDPSSRGASSKKHKESGGAGGGFSFSNLTSQIGRFVSAAVSDRSKQDSTFAVQTITAPQVVECMSLFVICASNDDARLHVAQHLLEFLQQPQGVEPAFYLAQLTAIAESIPSMSLLLLTEFLQAVEEAAHRLDASAVLVVLARKLTDVEHVTELHIMKLIAFFASLGSRSHTAATAVLNSGVVRSTTRLVEMVGIFPSSGSVLRHIVHLWRNVARVPGSWRHFEECQTAEMVLQSMQRCGLARVSLCIGTSGLHTPASAVSARLTNPFGTSASSHHDADDENARSGPDLEMLLQGQRREILALSREALLTLVAAKQSLVVVLLDNLLHLTGKSTWSDELSALLCLLATVLHDNEACLEDAIRGNAIELCLSLLQSVECSGRVAEETALLCTCLTAMLPSVRFSEVGRMLTVSIPSPLVGSTVVCQMLADLALGATRCPRHVNALMEWYDDILSGTTDPRASTFQRAGTRVGTSPFFTPSGSWSFCELTFPLLELCRWYHAELLREDAGPPRVGRDLSLEDLCDGALPRAPLSIAAGMPPPRRHTAEELAQLVHAVAARLGAPLTDPGFADFVLSLGLVDLVPYVADICATPMSKAFFFLPNTCVGQTAAAATAAGPLASSQPPPNTGTTMVAQSSSLERVIRMWEAVVVPRAAAPSNTSHQRHQHHHGSATTTGVDPCRVDFPHHIQCFGAGGATGAATAGSEGWPSPDGYSVVMWCWWTRLAHRDDAAHRYSGGTSSEDDDTATIDATTVPLWCCQWASPDPSAAPCSVALDVDLAANCTVLSVLYNGATHTMELPLIPASTWTHVAVSHSRSRLFNSEASVYMDGALVAKRVLTYPLTVLTQASGFAVCSQLVCRIGFPRADGVAGRGCDASTHGDAALSPSARSALSPLRLKVGPVQVYNAPLVRDAVMSLFAASIHSLHAGRWGAHGDQPVSATAVVLDRSYLNYLVAAASNDVLNQAVDAEVLSFVAPPSSALLIALHPSAAAMVDAKFRYLDNHDWALVNLADAAESKAFVLYGPHSEPTARCVDAAHALVANGGTTEWLRWLDLLTSDDAVEEPVTTQVGSPTSCTNPAAPAPSGGSFAWASTACTVVEATVHSKQAIARAAINVIAACVARVSVKELRHRAFYYNISLLLKKRPRLFFSIDSAPSTEPSDDGFVDSNLAAITSFYRTLVHADGTAIGAKVPPPTSSPHPSTATTPSSHPASGSGSVLLPVLSNTAACEMIFANVAVWTYLPEATAEAMLRSIRGMLAPSNRYRRLNALRLKTSGFVFGFLYGLVREFVVPTLLHTAIDVVDLFVSAMDDHMATMSDLLTFLAATTATESDDKDAMGKRLGTRLAGVAPDYITLVRNLVLRMLYEAMVSSNHMPSGGGSFGRSGGLALTQTFGEVAPMSWVHAMTGRRSHPTTVALTLQIVVHTLHNHPPFRHRAEKANLAHLLSTNLAHHSHQPDVTSLLLHGFLGHTRNVMVYQSTLVDDGLTPDAAKGVPYLIHVVMSLQKSNAIGARDPAQIARATQYYEQLPASAYFSQAGRFLSNYSVRRSSRKLRAAVTVVLLTVHLAALRARRCNAVASSQQQQQQQQQQHAAATSDAPCDVYEDVVVDGQMTPVRGTFLSHFSPVSAFAPDMASQATLQEHKRILEDECVRRKDLVTRVLNWAAFAFLKHDYVACAMFNPAAICAASAGGSSSALASHSVFAMASTPPFVALQALLGDAYPIDFVPWILVCALGDAERDVATAASPSGAMDGTQTLANDEVGAAASPEGLNGSDDDGDDDHPFFSDAATRERCLSVGLDTLPRPAHEPMFQACCNAIVAVMELQVRDYVAVHVGRHSVKTSPFALVLHHLLSICPSGIGDHAESWYHAAVVSLWLQTTCRALQRHSLKGEQGHHLSKNCVSVAHYVTERLVSGLPVPPGGVMEFLVVLLGSLQYPEHLKQVRHLVIEWYCFVASPRFHGCVASRAQSARDLLHAHRHVMFAPQTMALPAFGLEVQKHLLLKLLELSCSTVTGYESTQTPDALRLAELWQAVLVALRQSPAVSFVLAEGCGSVRGSLGSSGGGSHVDFLHGGIDILNQRIGATSMFLSWLADTRYSIHEYTSRHAAAQPLHHCKVPSTNGFCVQGKRYLKWMVATVKAIAKGKAKHHTKIDAALLFVVQSYDRMLTTSTFVDPELLKQREYARSDILVVPCPPNTTTTANSQPPLEDDDAPPAPTDAMQTTQTSQSTPPAAQQQQSHHGTFKYYWNPHGGVRSTRWYPSEAHAQSRLVELGGEPIGVYLSNAPVSMVPLQAGSTVDGVSVPQHGAVPLKPNAQQILERILHGGSVQPKDSRVLWIGNVYYVVGTESIICTLVVTRSELVWISHSQVTHQGDFFVTQIATHTAADKAHKSRNAAAAAAAAFQEAISRFLPRQAASVVLAAGGSGGASSPSSGKLAISLSTHRHSQYYRQLRTEALKKDRAAFVWRCSLGTAQTIHHRRFQHQSCGLEFVSENGTTHFFVVLDYDMTMSKECRGRLLAVLQPLLPPRCEIESHRIKEAKLHAAEKRWVRGALSTRAYLNVLNDAASRTTSDLSQYPIMPWVLNQYDEIFVDVHEPSSYRDLSKPMGALHAANAAQCKMRYDEWPDDTQPPFHYGTHYSTSAVAMYYLVRLEPFHQWSVRYQGGRLDVADRLFHSVAEAWTSASGAGSDVKELIPEFYSTAASWAANANCIALGMRRDGVALHDVALPPWCRNRPEVFANTLCEALESDTVSASIHQWFDLIFGYKQRGDEAVKALNVFHHLAYDDGLEQAMEAALSEEDRKAIVASVDNFGLIPRQLFAAPHPKRQSTSALVSRQLAFLASLSQLVKRPGGVVHYPASPRTGERMSDATITDLLLIDSMVYASNSIARYTCGRHIHVVYLDEATGSVFFSGGPAFSSGGGAGGPPSAAAASGGGTMHRALPSSTAFGAGWVSTLCVSECNNIIVCGTDRGCVVVFSRSTADSAFSISNFIYAGAAFPTSVQQSSLSPVQTHAASPRQASTHGRVRLVKMWPDGQLLVSSEPGQLTAWLVTHKSTAFCFAVDVRAHLASLAPHAAAAQSPDAQSSFSATVGQSGGAQGAAATSGSGAAQLVRCLSRDDASKHYYVATDRHLLIISNVGVVLAHLCVSKASPYNQGALVGGATGGSTHSSGALASAVLSAQTLDEPITSIAFAAFGCHCSTNVLLCGHANGCMSVWSIYSDANPANDAIRALQYHSCVVVDKGTAITAIVAVMDASTILVGLASGGVVVFGLPHAAESSVVKQEE